MEKENKLWDKGEKLYDDFIEALFKKPRMDVQLPTPRTNELELFALLDKKGEKTLLIGAMCRQIVDNIDDIPFAENGELFENITIRRKF